MAEYIYVVRKQFKYNGEVLGVGDIWEPCGSKHDRSIKKQKGLVIMQEVESGEQEAEVEHVKPVKKARRGRPRKHVRG